MITYNSIFSNYAEFKEIFTVRECNNGEKARTNKLLLTQLKDKNFRKFLNAVKYGASYNELADMFSKGDFEVRHKQFSYAGDVLYNCSDTTAFMARVRCTIDSCFGQVTIKEVGLEKVHSDIFEIDDLGGICEDGDATCVRYVSKENHRVWKMKAGKFYRKLLLEQPISAILSPQIVNYMCEEFAADWAAYVSSQSNYTLHLGDNEDDFRRIYDSSECASGCFHSCMVNQDQHHFYYKSVNAKAAWLENEDGKIVARCIVFPEVFEVDSDKIWKLAERQYSADSDLTLMRILITKLIAAGVIDGYKKVGVDCHSSKAYVDNSGNSLSDKTFYVKCWLEPEDDILSYQDSFKYYDYDSHKAYNSDCMTYDYALDTTDRHLEYEEDEGENWDSWHEEYTDDDVVTVYYHGREYTCNENRLDDFRYVESEQEYHYYEDVYCCEYCEEYFLEGEGYYSEFLEQDFCCQDCMDTAIRNELDCKSHDYILDYLNELEHDGWGRAELIDHIPNLFDDEEEESDEDAA